MLHLQTGITQSDQQPHLVSVGMTANDNGFLPARHQTRDVAADDCLAEHSATQDVTDGAIGGLPHLLEVEFWIGHKRRGRKKK